MPPAIPPKLLNLQSLRAYGALAVAFYHTGFSLCLGRPTGSFGVGIFFVISGFIMAMICNTNPRHFLARRIARVVPLYWVLTLAVFFIGTMAPYLLSSTAANPVFLVKSLFFIPYFNHGAFFPILFLGWTLNYEMYFYLLIAIALLIHERLAPLIASGVMVSLMLLLYVLKVRSAASFYAHPVMLEFILGVLCYYVFLVVPGGAFARIAYSSLLQASQPLS